MKRKHKDAMIAMGIKISALEQIQRNHGQAHLAQDISPQLSQHILDHKANSREIEIWTLKYHKRVEELEKRMVQIDIHRDRLADHDESIEALSETVDQLSSCKSCHNFAALEEDRRRIVELEKTVYNSPFSKIVMEDYAARIGNLEESADAFLKSIPDIEILKTQMIGLVRNVDALQIRLSRAQDMIAEMQRDSRILKSPGYKKEIAAQKQDAKSKKAK